MTKWIRWPGLAAFIVITALLVAGFMFLSGPFIAKAIEVAGTGMVGAKVDVAGARPGLFPLGLRLSGIEITDPDAPMTNAVEIANISMRMDTKALMLRKIDVTEMTVEGIRLGTPRRVSGALPEKDKKDKGRKETGEESASSLRERIPMPSMEIPDVQIILERASLGSLEEAENLEKALRQEYERFDERLKNLPDADDFRAYRTRIENLKRGSGLSGVLTGARELREIKSSVDKDILALRNTRREMEESIADLRRRMASLGSMASEDVNNLMERYGISDEGLSNITGILLGPEWENRLRKGLGLYRRVEPLLDRVREREKKPEPEKVLRSEGVDILFAEIPVRPDFLIRRASLSLEVPVGNLKGTLRNATAQQPLVGSPMEIRFKGDSLSDIESFDLQLVFDRVNPKAPTDHLKAGVSGWHPETMGSGDLALNAEKGDFSVDLISSRGALKGKMALDLTGVSFEMPDSGDRVRAAVASGLRDINRITVQGDLGGTLEKPEIKLSSSLDAVVRGAVTRAAREATETLRARLHEEVHAMTDKKIRELENQLGGMADLRAVLDERLNLAGRLDI
ncbi:TIGR03545 family protein [Desulfobotulus mexicanus]|uniref:TIGR03545 family protein n=1 Tax=Desulfobotulus mexicanus TaxID=2586642 RepID=A0A5S5MDP5_9BACT|nr:TIGR03545 family protein [Desulfobotulus mexicanus]TYT73848.1 TIGR03545 family protein [Desulfobotulus mexicanus]